MTAASIAVTTVGTPRRVEVADVLADAFVADPVFGWLLPDADGRRVALRRFLRRCDAQGLPAYLEASSPDNARLYRRLGFVTDDVLRAGDAPPMELMTRPPR